MCTCALWVEAFCLVRLLKATKKTRRLTWRKIVLKYAQLCKTRGWHTILMMPLFPCGSHEHKVCDVYLTLASLILPCGVDFNASQFCIPPSPFCETDQTQKQVMTTSVWSCSAWKQWQTCNPCRTSTAPPWRGARRLWRKQTSTSELEKAQTTGAFCKFFNSRSICAVCVQPAGF